MRNIKKAVVEAKKLPHAHYLSLCWQEISDIMKEASKGSKDTPQSIEFNLISIAYDVGITTGFRLGQKMKRNP